MESRENELDFYSLFVPLTAIKSICIIWVIGFLLFFNSFFNSFVADDFAQVVDNPRVHSMDIIGFFGQSRLNQIEKSALGANYYKPVLDSSFALLYAVFGNQPFGFHFAQVVLFIINCCLIFLLFSRFFRIETAFFLSLIYLVHPINHEAAIYVSALQETLFTFFGLLAVLALFNRLSAILAFVLLSLFSKETGALYLIILLVFVSIYRRKILMKYVIGVAAGFGVYLLLRINAVGLFEHNLVNAPIQQLSFAERILNIPAIGYFYLRAFLFPLKISSSYQWVVKSTDFPHFVLPMGIVLGTLGILVYFGYLLKKRKDKYFKTYLVFSLWLFFGVGFHLQLMPLDQTVAERWFYFPMVGTLGILGVAWESFKIESTKFRIQKAQVIKFFLVMVVLLLSFRTFLRILDYRNNFSLAKNDLAVSPESYNLEYMISRIYYDQNKLDLAEAHAQKSVELFPFITNYTNLGAIYSKEGNYAKAKESYLKALEYGDDRLPYENLAALSLVYGERVENIEYLKKVVLVKYPDNGRIWMRLSLLEYMNGDLENAKKDIEQAKKLSNDQMTLFAQSLIDSGKKLEIKAEGGEIRFLLKD